MTDDQDFRKLMGDLGFGELDSATLNDPEEYLEYFKYIRSVFQGMFKWAESIENKVSNQDSYIVSEYLIRMLKTIELLQLKYRYDENHKISIDLTDSSFPNHKELRQMFVDSGMREELVSQLETVEILKDRIIGALRKGSEPLDLLDQLSKKEYLDRLDPQKLFLLMNQGEIVEDFSNFSSNRKLYNYSWGIYDIQTNYPVIYLMKFEYGNEEHSLEENENDLKEFYDVLQRATNGSGSSLGEIAIRVDQDLFHIHPKVIKKIEIGPLYGKYSKDEHPLSNFLKINAENDPDAFIAWSCVQEVSSVKEYVAKGSVFKKGQILQEFYVNRPDTECLKKKVSKIDHYMIAPHGVAQLLRSDDIVKPLIEHSGHNLFAL